MCRPTLLNIFGLMVRQTIGFSDYWSFGPMVHRNIGMSPTLHCNILSTLDKQQLDLRRSKYFLQTIEFIIFLYQPLTFVFSLKYFYYMLQGLKIV